MRDDFIKLKKHLEKRFPKSNLEIVQKAYRFANEAHREQVRNSGEPYIMHCIAVADILAMIGLDPVTCAAAMLHDVLEDTKVTRKQLDAEFGKEIGMLVEGVTKLSSYQFEGDALSREEKQAQNFRKLLVATAQDVRVLLIKLADRLHNIRTIEHLPEQRRKRISRETLDIYSPLAHRLGISTWKWELEDHAFHELMPEEYKWISQQVNMKRKEREEIIRNTISFLEQRLAESEIPARVIGRSKHLYSIWRKIEGQGKSFNEVMDVQGARIITQSETGCYNALGVVHSLWKPMPGRFKDYIATPKNNMYQAIHTTVMRENGKPMEIQIRSEEMDRKAREGIAAHWIYKEGKKTDRKLDLQLSWLSQLHDWVGEVHGTDELMDSVRRDFQPTDIYVFTPKGEVKELPEGATPLDFAYMIHSQVGHHYFGARVNGRMVQREYHLQTGDVVEILTSRNQEPTRDWLNIVITGHARSKIRQRLRETGELTAKTDATQRKTGEEKSKSTGAEEKPAKRASKPAPQVQEVDEATRAKMIRVEGAGGIQVQFANCCNPMPGQEVVAYATKTLGITVHAKDCKSFLKSARDEKRILMAYWEGQQIIESVFRVVVGQRPNVLADLTHVMRPLNVDVIAAQYEAGTDGLSYFDFVCQTSDTDAVEQLKRKLQAVTGVRAVETLADTTRAPARNVTGL